MNRITIAKTHIVFVAVIIFMAMLTSCQMVRSIQQELSGYGYVKGRIAYENGDGVPGVQIDYPGLELSSQVTDETGEFHSYALTSGEAYIRIWKDGYSPLSIHPEIIPNQVITIEVIVE